LSTLSLDTHLQKRKAERSEETSSRSSYVRFFDKINVESIGNESTIQSDRVPAAKDCTGKTYLNFHLLCWEMFLVIFIGKTYGTDNP